MSILKYVLFLHLLTSAGSLKISAASLQINLVNNTRAHSLSANDLAKQKFRAHLLTLRHENEALARNGQGIIRLGTNVFDLVGLSGIRPSTALCIVTISAAAVGVAAGMLMAAPAVMSLTMGTGVTVTAGGSLKAIVEMALLGADMVAIQPSCAPDLDTIVHEAMPECGTAGHEPCDFHGLSFDTNTIQRSNYPECKFPANCDPGNGPSGFGGCSCTTTVITDQNGDMHDCPSTQQAYDENAEGYGLTDEYTHQRYINSNQVDRCALREGYIYRVKANDDDTEKERHCFLASRPQWAWIPGAPQDSEEPLDTRLSFFYRWDRIDALHRTGGRFHNMQTGQPYIWDPTGQGHVIFQLHRLARCPLYPPPAGEMQSYPDCLNSDWGCADEDGFLWPGTTYQIEPPNGLTGIDHYCLKVIHHGIPHETLAHDSILNDMHLTGQCLTRNAVSSGCQMMMMDCSNPHTTAYEDRASTHIPQLHCDENSHDSAVNCGGGPNWYDVGCGPFYCCRQGRGQSTCSCVSGPACR